MCIKPHEVGNSRSRHLSAKLGGCQANPSKGATCTQITMSGLDLTTHVFQVHVVNATGEVVLRKALRRAQLMPFFTTLPPNLIGI